MYRPMAGARDQSPSLGLRAGPVLYCITINYVILYCMILYCNALFCINGQIMEYCIMLYQDSYFVLRTLIFLLSVSILF